MKNIVVPVDFSSVSDEVISQAKRLAKAFRAKIWTIYVMSPSDEDDSRFEKRQLQHITDQLKEEKIEAESLLLSGPITSEILIQAENNRADLIVVGSHGRTAVFKDMFGSVSEGILKSASCPVMVIRSNAQKEQAK